VRPRIHPGESWIATGDGAYAVGGATVVIGELEVPDDVEAWKASVLAYAPPGVLVYCLNFGPLRATVHVADVEPAEIPAISASIATAQLPPASLAQLLDGLMGVP
jgi:hypothetical protein